MPGVRLLSVGLLSAALLAGCGAFGGVDDELERLRQPPDLGLGSPTGSASAPPALPPAQGELVLAAEPARLLLPDPFYEAWRRVALTLDRLGFTLEDRDRTAGQYFVRYDPQADGIRREKGFLESLAFWRGEPDRLALYVIQLQRDGRQTVVTVTDAAGADAPAEVAERILPLVHEQLR